MYGYYKQAIEPVDERLRRRLGIRTIVVKYEPTKASVRVLTAGEVLARGECTLHKLDKIGV